MTFIKYLQKEYSGIRKLRHWLLLCLFFLLLMGCDTDRIYEENRDFHNKQWVVSDTPTFQFTIDDPQQTYNIYWNVRNTISYPYQNLYLTYFLEDTLGHRLDTDLHNMQLFAPKTGEPYGDGLGDIFSHQFLAIPQHKFDTAGVYQIKLEQYMRTDTLPEIISVGVRVEEAENS